VQGMPSTVIIDRKGTSGVLQPWVTSPATRTSYLDSIRAWFPASKGTAGVSFP